jgi:DNA repair photolyase
MKRWGKLNPIRFDAKELKTDLGQGNTIFVGNTNDMFAIEIDDNWIRDTLNYCSKFDNIYIFQSKNTFNLNRFIDYFPNKIILGTTLETNRRDLLEEISRAPSPQGRLAWFERINRKKFITVEPIMDFDLELFAEMIIEAKPNFVNIGADSNKKNNLPEPRWIKVLNLIDLLKKSGIGIRSKSNLKRLKEK